MSAAGAKVTAADIMNRDVVVVYEQDTLEEAMTLIIENHVTGLPVVNASSQCVGLVSATDILTYEQQNAEITGEANDEMAQHYDPETGKWESIRVSSYALEQFGEVKVGEIMARDLVSVSSDTPVKEVAQTMCHAGVHRVVVLDGNRGLLGIISALDFVRLSAES